MQGVAGCYLCAALERVGRRIAEQRKVYDGKFLPALDTLRHSDDGVAQTEVGCFYCFYKGDWDRGLPHLQRGAITTWQRLAEQELRGAASDNDRLLLAAGWWEAASSSQPFAREQIKLHAARWYQRALPKLALGDARDAVEAKLREVRLDANSEAVARGVRWLTDRQLDDGSWTFKSEPDPGNFNNQLAATAMALRALLEADLGDGSSQAAIRNGLQYVRKRGKEGDYRGATEPQSNMYVQAMATIALAEGYAYTKDSKLRKEAQQAVQFILAAQDPSGGGWRYTPRESPGDLASTGWQIVRSMLPSEPASTPTTRLVSGRELFFGFGHARRRSELLLQSRLHVAHASADGGWAGLPHNHPWPNHRRQKRRRPHDIQRGAGHRSVRPVNQ